MHNRFVHKPGFNDIHCQPDNSLSVGSFDNLPNLTANESLCPSACFIGPQGENAGLMKALAAEAVQHIQDYRKDFAGQDPALQRDAAHDASVDTMGKRFTAFLDFLGKKATPFPSMRYQAHMLSDNLLPGLAAYFATMMHNPNNVTIQASTETTLMEMLVMHDLCGMFGFDLSPADTRIPPPWAHITVDGSVANLEGLWGAREAKFLALAARNAYPEIASKVKITLCNGNPSDLAKARDWELLNLTRDERLAIPERIMAYSDESRQQVWSKITAKNINTLGWAAFSKANSGRPWPRVVIPSTAHYSWPKAAALLGLRSEHGGDSGITHVEVDVKARMDVGKLRVILEDSLKSIPNIPILAVVSVFGSTEESAVDPLDGIIGLRDEYRQRGLDFDIHVDAAWGGYFTSTIRKEFSLDPLKPTPADPFIDATATARVPLNQHVVRQAKLIRQADSVTVDAHKMGYIQYPNGSIIYRNQDVTNLTTFTGSYIGSASEPNVGLFGVEGSRPGAAAAALFFAHSCVRPDCTGYGEIINRSLHNAKQFYAHLLFLAGPGWRVVPLACGPDPSTTKLVRDKLLDKSLAAIRADVDPHVMKVFQELGPDQNVVDYGINFLVGGAMNASADKYNEYVKKLYDAMRVMYDSRGEPGPIPHDIKFMVSMTTFERKDYGDVFINDFAQRLGIKAGVADPVDKLNCLRSTVMTPFVSETVRGTYWPDIMKKMAEVITTVKPAGALA